MKAFASHYGLLAFSVYELFRVHDVDVVFSLGQGRIDAVACFNMLDSAMSTGWSTVIEHSATCLCGKPSFTFYAPTTQPEIST